MGYECRVERDSISPSGVRLTTFVTTFPRFILAEVNTHRVLSRNSASSRAIPLWKRIQAVFDDPYVPERFGGEKAGMQAGEWLEGEDHERARRQWLKARDDAVTRAVLMLSPADRRRTYEKLTGSAGRLVAVQLDGHGPSVSVHKSWLNRLLEPFCWHTAILSGTNWANLFAQRCHEAAQPEFRVIAEMMRFAMKESTPRRLEHGQWHLPFIQEEDVQNEPPCRLKMVSAGRCARVSYLNHEGVRDPDEDVRLAEKLMDATPRHASPFEHPATPAAHGEAVKGNFRDWKQFRHEIPNESIGD